MSSEIEDKISQNECLQLAQIMNIKYAAARKQRFFSIKTAVEGSAAIISVVLENENQSFYYPVDGRVEYKSQNISVREGILLLADYIDAYFEEFFREDENVFIPIDWTHFQFEGVDIQLKGQVLNMVHERLADGYLHGRS